MKILQFILVSFFLLFAVETSAQKESSKKAETLQWHTDMMKANEISTKENKPLFAFFTGSDWCIWCKKLQANVFSKPDFIQWANKNVVLVELDFPRGKTLSPELQQQNYSLAQTFRVQGYPTVWMFKMVKDSSGTRFNLDPYGQLGYPQAEPGKESAKFINDANILITNKQAK